MRIILEDIRLSPGEPESTIADQVRKRCGENIPLESLTLLRRSLDARKKSDIHFRCRLSLNLPDRDAERLIESGKALPFIEPPSLQAEKNLRDLKFVIVGSGPAGLFAALRLIERGASVTIIERGKSVPERIEDIERLEREGVLNPESNVLFGEGGAGTYSDGKLTTRINRPEIAWVFDRLEEFGVGHDTLAEAHPHVGTDRLRGLLDALRQYLVNSGSQIFFGEKFTGIIVHDGKVVGITTDSGKEYRADAVFLATGHSARDTYQKLHDMGVILESKAFAVGFRVEHPADVINMIQYGKFYHKKNLPPAEYRLTWNNRSSARGVYSFCMCPGGRVVNSSSEQGGLCVNGMSYSDRGHSFSNAAIVVSVRPEDFGPGPLGGIEFQRGLEVAAFNAGKDYRAPAQRLTSFLKKREDSSLPASSYLPGTVPVQLGRFVPEFVSREIISAAGRFNETMRGFVSDEALLIGVETRTSSPIRIVRNNNGACPGFPGLYPLGEGAGYAGGIISSAVDGMRMADRIVP